MKLLARLAGLLGLAAAGPALAAGVIRADPLVMEGAFRPGFTTVIPDRDGPVSFRVVELGRLKITSGRIVACDPLVRFDTSAFTVTVPPGDYPVRLAYAVLAEDHYRVALARVDFSSAHAVRWEMALTPGQSLGTLKKSEVFTYGVDSGTGAFADAEAFAWADAHSDGEAPSDAWIAAGEAEGAARAIPHGFLALVEAGPKNNIAIFSSGWGDGGYASWIGYDAEGRVVALVTDFAVVTAVTGL